MELVSEAIVFAVKAHDGMRRRKSDAPYALHPMETTVIVGAMMLWGVDYINRIRRFKSGIIPPLHNEQSCWRIPRLGKNTIL